MKRIFVLAGAFALLAFAAVLGIPELRQEVFPPPGTAEWAAARSSAAGVTRASGAPAGGPAAPEMHSPARDSAVLPPEDTPASDSYASLKRMADAGSPRAACRLSFELMRCQELLEGSGVRTALEGREASALKPIGSKSVAEWQLKAANELATRQIEITRREADCRKLPAGAIEVASNYLYQAAAGGNAAAQVRYISGHMFGTVADESVQSFDLALLHHPEFDRWRRSAPAMAKQLLAAHPSAGVYLMTMAYSRDRLPFEALIPDDPLLAEAYLGTSRRIIGLPARTLEQFDQQQRDRIAVLDREIARKLPAHPAQEPELALGAPGSSLGEWSDSGCEAGSTKR